MSTDQETGNVTGTKHEDENTGGENAELPADGIDPRGDSGPGSEAPGAGVDDRSSDEVPEPNEPA